MSSTLCGWLAVLHLRPAGLPSGERFVLSKSAKSQEVLQWYTFTILCHMPTVNPRVNVTLSPSLFALVTRFADVQRASRSDVLRELLETAAPALERAVALMEAASKAKPEMLRGMASAMDKAQARIEGILEGSMAAAEAQADLVDLAQAVKARRPARGRVSGPGPAGVGSADAKRRSRPRSGLVASPSSNRGGK